MIKKKLNQFTDVQNLRAKSQMINLKIPQVENGRDSNERSMRSCFHNGPSCGIIKGICSEKLFCMRKRRSPKSIP